MLLFYTRFVEATKLLTISKSLQDPIISILLPSKSSRRNIHTMKRNVCRSPLHINAHVLLHRLATDSSCFIVMLPGYICTEEIIYENYL